MPGGDRTGPLGAGSMTGRGAGFCTGYSVPGFMNPVGGRGYAGFGRGFGAGGRGWRNRYYATGFPLWGRQGYTGVNIPVAYPSANKPQQEQEILKQQAEYLSNSLQTIQNRIEELQKNVSQ